MACNNNGDIMKKKLVGILIALLMITSVIPVLEADSDTANNISGDANQNKYPSINQIGGEITIPPGIPTITGPTAAGAEIDLNFTAVATDPEEEQLYYLWDWGDGHISEWLGPFESGENVTNNHSWTNNREYEIRAKAKNVFNN